MNPFKVIQSNPNQKGGFVTKMQRETVVEDSIFGAKIKKETLYVSGIKEVAVDTEVSDEHIKANYRIEEHPSELIDNKTGDKIVMNLKWLHLK